jgi:hypothetical protein
LAASRAEWVAVKRVVGANEAVGTAVEAVASYFALPAWAEFDLETILS